MAKKKSTAKRKPTRKNPTFEIVDRTGKVISSGWHYKADANKRARELQQEARRHRSTMRFRVRQEKSNPAPAKMRRVNQSTGWIAADAVRFVKRPGKPPEVFIKRKRK